MKWVSFLVLLFSVPSYAQLSVSKISDLEFGVAAQGDLEKIVNPLGYETAENASFLVTGPANTSYSIILPRRLDLSHSSGTGPKLRVQPLNSIPAEGNNGFLNSSGQQYIFLGGTREAISKNLTTGSYSTSFVLEVIF